MLCLLSSIPNYDIFFLKILKQFNMLQYNKPTYCYEINRVRFGSREKLRVQKYFTFCQDASIPVSDHRCMGRSCQAALFCITPSESIRMILYFSESYFFPDRKQTQIIAFNWTFIMSFFCDMKDLSIYNAFFK